jgi:hypothetical protein
MNYLLSGMKILVKTLDDILDYFATIIINSIE